MLDTEPQGTLPPPGDAAAAATTLERLSALEAQIAMFQLQNACGFGVTPLVAERLRALEAEIEDQIVALKAGVPPLSGRSPSV